MARGPAQAFPVKKLLPLTAEMAGRVREYRFAQRIPSENEAIRRLIAAGLTAGAATPIRGSTAKPSGGPGDHNSRLGRTGGDAGSSSARKPTAPKLAAGRRSGTALGAIAELRAR